jgi:hypothetical protein
MVRVLNRSPTTIVDVRNAVTTGTTERWLDVAGADRGESNGKRGRALKVPFHGFAEKHRLA